jgi:hypothetical protein
MSHKLLPDLMAKGALSLLQFSADEWEDVRNTRNGMSRFSLTFEHSIARSGRKNSLVLIAVASSQFVNPHLILFDIQKSLQLYLGIVNFGRDHRDILLTCRLFLGREDYA